MSLGFLDALKESGGDWVIWLLLAASVWVVAVAVERGIVLRRERKAFDVLHLALEKLLNAGDVAKAAEMVRGRDGAAARILAAGLSQTVSPETMEERMSFARLFEKRALDRHLLVLGTLGNNAPFIGLFGTVLGVIKAFRDLATAASAGPEVVMSGLSQALIATAVGLLVAIPSVIGYNLFQKWVSDLLAETDALAKLLTAAVRESHGRRD